MIPPNVWQCLAIDGAFVTLNSYQWQMKKINFHDRKILTESYQDFRFASMGWLVTVLENERKCHWHKEFVVINEMQMKYSNIFKPHTTAILRCA